MGYGKIQLSYEIQRLNLDLRIPLQRIHHIKKLQGIVLELSIHNNRHQL